MSPAKKLSLVFAAGCFGGALNGLVVWLFGTFGITTALGVSISPAMSGPFIYHRIVWGGLWGLLLLFPFYIRNTFFWGFILSLLPTLVQLLIVFPGIHKGLLGIHLGTLTPLFVIIFNAVWGVATLYWYKISVI